MNIETKIKLFFQMYRIRAVEQEIANRYPEGKMRCPVHLSIGQESIPAIFANSVRVSDFAVSTHRGHAHYLAKGGSLKAMIAELYGKQAGCAKGKGGSMHLIDLSVNFMGTSAIVGNSIPVGVGLALSSQIRATEQISCVFLGDGATEEGVFYESINFAVVRKLPVLFICENNFYSVYSPLTVRQPKDRSIANMVEAMGISTSTAEGSDLQSCDRKMNEAFHSIRAGRGPYFLEFSTYRWREHCGPNFDNDLGYRPAEEFSAWSARDPLTHLEAELNMSNSDVISTVGKIKSNVQRELQLAFELAESCPFPDASDAYKDVYA